MKDVLFIQGAGDASWDLKLVESLRRGRCEVRYPPMRHEYDTRFSLWKPTIETELAALQDGAIVVGHP